jgi:hypothetical protein
LVVSLIVLAEVSSRVGWLARWPIYDMRLPDPKARP